MFGHVFNQLAAHAEDQLDERQRARVDRHLQACAACRGELARIQSGIAWASTLTSENMPEDVAIRIKREIAAVGTTKVMPSGNFAIPATEVVPSGNFGIRAAERVPSGNFGIGAAKVLPSGFLRVAAAATLVLAFIGLYWHLNRPWIQLHAAAAAPTEFEEQGRRLHNGITSGNVPLAFHSSDEQALWRWLASQDAPVTSMVVSRPEHERANFVPIGATVRTLDDARTSVLAYRIDGRPVTLALASSGDVTNAPPAGWWSKRVTHRADADGVNTLTWTVGGGTYVMVSELEGAGQRACLICHTSPAFVGALTRLSIPELLDVQ